MEGNLQWKGRSYPSRTIVVCVFPYQPQVPPRVAGRGVCCHVPPHYFSSFFDKPPSDLCSDSELYYLQRLVARVRCKFHCERLYWFLVRYIISLPVLPYTGIELLEGASYKSPLEALCKLSPYPNCPLFFPPFIYTLLPDLSTFRPDACRSLRFLFSTLPLFSINGGCCKLATLVVNFVTNGHSHSNLRSSRCPKMYACPSSVELP